MPVKLIVCISLLGLVLASCTTSAQHFVEQLPPRIPEELVGLWATEGTVLNEGDLIKGQVFALTAHGTGYGEGSGPPGIGARLLVSYDARSSIVYFLISGESLWNRIRFDPVRRRMVNIGAPGGPFYWRSKSIPRTIMAQLGPELWEGERARLRNLVRDIDHYFPRLGYSRMTRLEEVVNYGNHPREEALRLLSIADEPALSSVREREIEIYRLIWFGNRRLTSFVVRVQRNQAGRASLVTTVDDEKDGEIVTRRRDLKEEDWAKVRTRLEAAKYFDLPLRIDETKPDGAWWIVEGWKGGVYQYVEARSPGRGPYRELCEFFIELAGFDPKLYERD